MLALGSTSVARTRVMTISRQYKLHLKMGSSLRRQTGIITYIFCLQFGLTFILLLLSLNRVLIPLSSDLEFFRTLTDEITSIDLVESQEAANITSHIIALSDEVIRVSKPSSFSRSSDLYAWRGIFQLYMESGIFFSPYERDGHKQHTIEGVERQINWFEKELERKGVVRGFKNKKSVGLLQEFLGINLSILRLLRFMEINKTAMRKILKSASLLILHHALPPPSPLLHVC